MKKYFSLAYLLFSNKTVRQFFILTATAIKSLTDRKLSPKEKATLKKEFGDLVDTL